MSKVQRKNDEGTPDRAKVLRRRDLTDPTRSRGVRPDRIPADRAVYAVAAAGTSRCRWRWAVWSSPCELSGYVRAHLTGSLSISASLALHDACAGGFAYTEDEAVALALAAVPKAVRVARYYATPAYLLDRLPYQLAKQAREAAKVVSLAAYRAAREGEDGAR